jgi:hypothetical protein
MERWTVMFMTIGGLLAFKNDGVGFIAGMMCHGVNLAGKSLADRESRRQRRDDARERRRSRQGTGFGEEEEQLLLGESERE